MKVLSEHIKQVSLETSLSTESFLLDGRTLKDRLHFLSQYASLLNFYDDQNVKRGNWQPILMKDPLFLLANISRFDVRSVQQQYLQTLNSLNHLLSSAASRARLGILVNQLFSLLTSLFLQLERWTYFMDRYQHNYGVKHYLFKEIKSKYAAVLRAVLAFQERINIYGLLPGVEPVDRANFNEFNAELWNAKGSLSFWKVLRLNVDTRQHSLKKELMALSPNEIVSCLKGVGKELTTFFHKVVNEADKAFEELKTTPSPFPDTVLLRAFSELMLFQQKTFNQLSDSHLNFYYQTILQQQRRKATADRTLISLELNPKTQAFLLPKGTRFKAGLDENKREIFFETLLEHQLYQAKVNKAYALTAEPKGTHEQLCLAEIANPSKLKKDKQGKALPWFTSGRGNTIASSQQMGLTIASPMLYLKEGNRTIRFLFEVAPQAHNVDQFSLAAFYLSTAEKWLSVDPKISLLEELSTQEVQTIAVDVQLTEKAEGIEAFKKNPDAYNSPWPLLKIAFDEFVNLKEPPRISAVTIEVAVSGVQQLELYNDFGKLNPKKPFQLFGPAPAEQSNFFIGSKELFSKPLHQLNLHFEWASLPASLDFAHYYEAYNYYPLTVETIQVPSTVQQPIPGLGKTKTVTTYTPKKVLKNHSYFNNTSFKTSFSYLNNGFWTDESGFIQSLPTSNPFEFLPQRSKGIPQPLYLSTADKLNNASFFNAETQSQEEILFAALAKLQLNDLTYSDKSSDGFLKMDLLQPEYGFGKEMYAKVIADVSLYNAANISKAPADKDPAVAQPNVPYSPLVKSLTATYHASFRYALTETPIYPIECFSYTPFKVNKVFGQEFTKQELETRCNFNFATPGFNSSERGVPLFTPLLSPAVLLMQLDKLESDINLSLYFQLATDTFQNSTSTPLSYTLMSGDVWVETPLISDSTKGFRCSGIVELNIPPNTTDSNTVLPEVGNWLAISSEGVSPFFAKALYLNTNGVELRRSDTNQLQETTTPCLPTERITALVSPLTEISKVVQPFASEGGKKAESQHDFRRRVSARIASKDRMVTATDYYTCIQREFPNVFYSHTFFDKNQGATTTYLVKRISIETPTSAPFCSPCELMEVEQFILPRVSALAKTKVTNFTPAYVGIQAAVVLTQGTPESYLNELGDKLDLFISPWIETDQKQVEIHQAITNHQVVNFLKSFEGVRQVEEVAFLVVDRPVENAGPPLISQDVQSQISAKPEQLFVPCGKHFLTVSTAL
jgi:hypothetical protein